MKTYFAILCGLLAVLVLAGTSQAGSLTPGASIANDSVAASAASGTLLADTGLLAYAEHNAAGTVVGTGFVREIVISGDSSNPNGLGALTFIYQVKATTGAVGHVTMSSYATWLTDASAVDSSVQNPLNPAGTPVWATTTANGHVSGLTPIHRTSLVADGGATVSFDFNDGLFGPGDVSDVMIVRTNATVFTTGFISVIDGGTSNMTGYAPGPEPSSFVLMALTGLSFTGLGIRRWFRNGRGA